MPGPFPGMDPYLEDPLGWPDVHDGLIACLRASLNALLPAEYAAQIQERCYIVHPQRDIVPDLTVRRQIPPQNRQTTDQGAVLTLGDPAVRVRLSPLQIRETTLEIVNLRDGRRVVTAMEILSPSNKAVNSKGNRLYRKKQRELLASRTHLIEIDLLRAGEPTVMVPLPALDLDTKWRYLACLYRAGQPSFDQEAEGWPILLAQRLPRIAVPLDAGVADIELDLQTVFDRNYDEGAYDRKIDYTRESVPPLPPDAALWAHDLLRAHGLRD